MAGALWPGRFILSSIYKSGTSGSVARLLSAQVNLYIYIYPQPDFSGYCRLLKNENLGSGSPANRLRVLPAAQSENLSSGSPANLGYIV